MLGYQADATHLFSWARTPAASSPAQDHQVSRARELRKLPVQQTKQGKFLGPQCSDHNMRTQRACHCALSRVLSICLCPSSEGTRGVEFKTQKCASPYQSMEVQARHMG